MQCVINKDSSRKRGRPTDGLLPLRLTGREIELLEFVLDQKFAGLVALYLRFYQKAGSKSSRYEGLIFIDLKADLDTVSLIIALCKAYGRTKELKLFDCSNPELSLPYNVPLRRNATEIKDLMKKLRQMFTKEFGPKPRQVSLPPAIPEGFPNLRQVKAKTTRAGGKKRARWLESDGNIYEWDYQHGRLEKYDRRGNHQGEFDSKTGGQTKPKDPTRRVEP